MSTVLGKHDLEEKKDETVNKKYKYDPTALDHLNSDDDEEGDYDDIEEETMTFDDNTIVQLTDQHSSMSVLQLMRGESDDELKLEETLEKYTKEDWDHLAKQILHSSQDDSCSDRQLIDLVLCFYQLFCFKFKDSHDVVNRVSAIYPDCMTMEQQNKRIQKIFGFMHINLENRNMLEDNQSGRAFEKMLTEIAYGMKMCWEQMINIRLMQHAKDSSMKSVLESMSPVTMFKAKDIEKLKPYQQLLHYYYREAHRNQYRRKGEALYKPRYNKNGDFVYAYEYVCDISNFVYEALFPTDQNQYYYNCFTERGGTPKYCITYLTHTKHEMLPELKPNRFVFAFRNGLFVTTLNRFYYFRKRPGKHWVGHLDGNITACRYHDIDFDEEGMSKEEVAAGKASFMGIELEGVRKILQHQQFTPEEMMWIYGLLGRFLFPVGKLDNWGVFPYFLGLAGTGKSTCLRLLASLFDPRDVAVLNNTLQKTFALDGLMGKYIYLGLDIDENFQLDQATFQSMVVGEEVAVIRKHKTPLTVLWDIQGGFAGNKLPNWKDNGGSLTRRMIVIAFDYIVKSQDTGLMDRCRAQIGRFLKVITSAYLVLKSKYGDAGIKKNMPQKFKVAEKEVSASLNILGSFINEWCVLYDEKKARTQKHYKYPAVEFQDFQEAYKAYRHAKDLKSETLTPQTCKNAFAMIGVKIQDTVTQEDMNKYRVKGKFIKGLSLKEDAKTRFIKKNDK